RPNLAGSRSGKKLYHRRPLSIENLPTGLSLRESLLVPVAPTRFSGGPPCRVEFTMDTVWTFARLTEPWHQQAGPPVATIQHAKKG
ncbi:MAG: hypothetical protein KDA80_18485, partial [Planctomycetaceae bacterium]|nr:hypothetical protein [Planctomycetaceae bacterium]